MKLILTILQTRHLKVGKCSQKIEKPLVWSVTFPVDQTLSVTMDTMTLFAGVRTHKTSST